MKILFLPISIVSGILAGLVGKKLFEAVWGAIDDEEPPEAEHLRISLGKLAVALALEGAIFRVVRGLVDHGARRGFMSLTGSWPGEKEPEPE